MIEKIATYEENIQVSSGFAIAPPRGGTLRTRPCKSTKRAEDEPLNTVMPPTQSTEKRILL
jgi:hypothetical protein